MVSGYRNCGYIYSDECISYQYFLKASTLEIAKFIERAQAGDQIALTYLLDFYWNEVYGFMLIRTENEADTDDITIETFAKAFEKIKTYNPEFQFNTWLIAIAKNVHIDMIRKRKSSPFVTIDDFDNSEFLNLPDTSLSAEDELIQEQNLARLLKYIKELKPHYQEVIQLRYFQEMSYQEIADKLEQPLSNVKIRILRAKNLLAEIIRGRK